MVFQVHSQHYHIVSIVLKKKIYMRGRTYVRRGSLHPRRLTHRDQHTVATIMKYLRWQRLLDPSLIKHEIN